MAGHFNRRRSRRSLKEIERLRCNLSRTGEDAGVACKNSPTAVPAHGLYSHQALGQVNNRPPIVVAIRQTWVNGAIGASNHPFTFLPSKSSGYLTR